MNVVQVKDLNRVYYSQKGIIKRKKVKVDALSNVNFQIKKGEIFGLLGPNGAGKTTTIKILTTLLLPSSGEVNVLGYNVDGEESEIRKKINFIYGGERSLYWRLSAYENLRYFADLHKIKRKVQEKRIDELLKLVGLYERKDEKVETYSKGMKQRLQIARGLMNDPEVLFLDEPTIGLDPVAAQNLRKIILKLKEDGKTILLTTHYMQEADELCDRIAFLNKGKILKIGTPDEIKSALEHVKILNVDLVNATDEQIKKIKVNSKIRNKGDITHISIETKLIFEVIDTLKEVFKESQFLNISTRKSTLEDAYIHILEGDING